MTQAKPGLYFIVAALLCPTNFRFDKLGGYNFFLDKIYFFLDNEMDNLVQVILVEGVNFGTACIVFAVFQGEKGEEYV